MKAETMKERPDYELFKQNDVVSFYHMQLPNWLVEDARVTEEEREMIERRMAQTGMKNMRAYIVKMAIDGRVIHVELESVREMVRLLSNATNNINQIAKRANETSNIYAADLDELCGRYDEIWGQTKVILGKLSDL